MNLLNQECISILRRHYVERLLIVLSALVGATAIGAAGPAQLVNAGFEDTVPLMDGGTIRITAERSGKLAVDAKQGGQFIEPLCNLIPSMLAQQVANTSFEDEPPWKIAFRREIDKPHRPWYPDGAVHLALFAFDTHQPLNGE